MRDVEDLCFKTLAYYLSDTTGIPTGQIWAKKPLVEFLSIPDGPNHPDGTSPYINTRVNNSVVFPAIAIDHIKAAELGYNNYGESIYSRSGTGTITEYKPMGEIRFFLSITLLTQSRKDLRDYGLKIQYFLLENKYLHFINDIFSGEYFNIEVGTQKEIIFEKEPLRKQFTIVCSARVLQETTGYEVETIESTIETTGYGGIAEEVIVYNDFATGLPTSFEEGIYFERTEEI